MLPLISRTARASPLRSNFIKSTIPPVTRALTTSNEALKANNLFDFFNYSAIVTGGGSGIGLMITQSLVANGAKVYITGRRKEALNTVVEKYSTGPGEIVA